MASSVETSNVPFEEQALERLTTGRTKLLEELRRVIVGQDEVVEHLILTLLVGGHCLITGMPGTAKTLVAWALAHSVDLGFKRVQLTPDLMPSDLLGLNPLTFSPPSDPTNERQLATTLAPVCTKLRTLFDQLGPR